MMFPHASIFLSLVFWEKNFGQDSLANYVNTLLSGINTFILLKKKSSDIFFKNLIIQKPLLPCSWPLCQEKC